MFLLDELREKANGIGALSNGERVQTTHEPDKVSEIIAKIVDLENEVNAMTDRYTNQRQQVRAIIHTLDNKKQEDVLTLIYLDGRTIHDTATHLKSGDSAVKKLRNRALKQLETTLKSQNIEK